MCIHEATAPRFEEAIHEEIKGRIIVPCDCMDCDEQYVTERVYEFVGEVESI